MMNTTFIADQKNKELLTLFKSLLGNNFHQFLNKIPYCGFDPAGVHYCVLRAKVEYGT